jgi:N utilization substance protein A
VSTELLQALNDLGKEKGIEPEVIMEAVEAALISAYKKNFGSVQNVQVTVDQVTGDFHVYTCYDVVEEVTNDKTEISLEDARKQNPSYELGDVITEEVTPRNFGRIAAQTAKQVVVQRIREAERGMIYSEFSGRESDIVTGTIQRIENRNYYIDLGKIEAVLGPNEQIPGESYQMFDRIKTYIVEVRKSAKGPQIMVSRTHPGLLKRLFELEVPEIQDGVVEIKSVAREAGARSKLSVYSNDENVDCIGACIGAKGARVQAIVDELRGEKIDIVKWNEDPSIYIANALSPAKVVDVQINEEEKKARVIVPDYQLSLAIGKEGQNARLAAKLTGWKIDIKSESQAQEAGIDYEEQDYEEQEAYLEG